MAGALPHTIAHVPPRGQRDPAMGADATGGAGIGVEVLQDPRPRGLRPLRRLGAEGAKAQNPKRGIDQWIEHIIHNG
jgi:hypothetical protein